MSTPAGTNRPLRVVLVGIDGAGKTTAARQLLGRHTAGGRGTTLFRNPGGRQRMNNIARSFGTRAESVLGWRALNAVETLVRVLAVLRTVLLSRSVDGVVLLDRYLYCQQALRRSRGLGAGRFVDWLLRALPAPDLVVYFALSPEQAHERIQRRGTDEESLEGLRSFNAAYRSLPGFAHFHLIDAGRPASDVVDQLEAAVDSVTGARTLTPRAFADAGLVNA